MIVLRVKHWNIYYILIDKRGNIKFFLRSLILFISL